MTRADNIFTAVRRHFWAVHLLFLGVAAYLAAGVVSAVIERRLDPTPAVQVSDLETSVASSSRSRTFYEPIVERNIFNSAAQPGDEEEFAEAELADLDLRLKGTIDAGDDRDLAIIRDNDVRSVDVYETGDYVAGARIVYIQKGAVTVALNGVEKVVPLQDIKTVSKRRRTKRSRRRNDPYAGIKRYGSRYVVPEDVVDNAMQNMGKLLRKARVVPNMKDGKINGFKIFRIRRNSLYRKIGLRNNDVIHSINGTRISGPEDGLQVLEEMRTARRLRIDLTRRGRKKTLTYTIR